ncbi:hypothetical protein EBB07_14825 [Paenibacillaceae bacterium]|nr:hypothetical protein EBB07_14825 [Paenibacillaceae bacterium]
MANRGDTMGLVRNGISDSMPIVVGYIPACITFGLVGKSLSLDNLEIFLLSAVVYAGASQFIGAKLIAAGAAAPIVLLLTIVINLRYLFISMSFSDKVDHSSSKRARGVLGFFLTEEVYAVSMMSKTNNKSKKHLFAYLLGLELPPYAITLLSTWVGIMLSDYIPGSILPAFNTSIYVLLIALIIPQLIGSRRNKVIVITAACASFVLQPFLGDATVLAAMIIGAWSGGKVSETKDGVDLT